MVIATNNKRASTGTNNGRGVHKRRQRHRPTEEEPTSSKSNSSQRCRSTMNRSGVALVVFWLVVSILSESPENLRPYLPISSMNQRDLQQAWGSLLQDIERKATAAALKLSDTTILNDDESVLDSLTLSNPIHCYNSTYCCGRWNVDADSWWLHKPHWEIVLETPVKFCFAPLKDPIRTNLLERLHYIQWNINITTSEHEDPNAIASIVLPANHYNDYTVNCSHDNLVTTYSISSGYGASMAWLYSTFWFAYTRNRPFQITKRGPWLYAKMESNDNNTSSTTNISNLTKPFQDCPDRDTTCFYLPLSPCSREDFGQEKIQRRPTMTNHTQVMEFLWMRDYMTRPNHAMRRALYHMKQPYLSQLLQFTSSDDNDEREACIALHVRRGDAGMLRRPYRRYAALQEYVDLLPPPPPPPPPLGRTDNTTTRNKPTIFLLSDDATTIDELHKHYDSHHCNSNSNSNSNSNNNSFCNYNWIYTNKTRVRGISEGFDGHVPTTSNGPLELLYITMEQDLAAKYCRTIVHGMSGYANLLKDRMQFYHDQNKNKNVSWNRHDAKNYDIGFTDYYLETRVSQAELATFRGRPDQRESHLFQQIESLYHNQTSNTSRSTAAS